MAKVENLRDVLPLCCAHTKASNSLVIDTIHL
jgi:hypothetical protein